MGNKLGTKKGGYSPLELITHKMQGYWLITYIDGEEWKRENIKMTHGLARDIKHYNEKIGEIIDVQLEGSGDVLPASVLETEKMAQTYCSVKHKYTHKHTRYKADGKYWQFFEKAAAIARDYNIDAYTYVTIIRNHYTSRIKENRVTFPWPSQMGGAAAEEIISNHIASKSKDVPEEVLALRMAQAKRNMPLDKDEYFLEAKARFKTRKFSRKDFEYVKIRYNQVGELPDWLDKYEKILEDKESES